MGGEGRITNGKEPKIENEKKEKRLERRTCEVSRAHHYKKQAGVGKLRAEKEKAEILSNQSKLLKIKDTQRSRTFRDIPRKGEDILTGKLATIGYQALIVVFFLI